MTRWMRLKPDVSPSHFLEQLRQLINDGRALRGFGVGPGGFIDLHRRYLDWTENVEFVLRTNSLDPSLAVLLQSERHWAIRRLLVEDVSVRPVPMVQGEVELQLDVLDQLSDELCRRLKALEFGSGRVAVVDTNLLLHYLPPEQIKWLELVGADHVQLLVPLRVIEELDEKKYSARAEKMRLRARRVLSHLKELLADGDKINVGIELTVFLDQGREGPVDADQEILDNALEARQFTSRDVCLVTGDTGMRLRARSLGLPTISMPDDYLRENLS